MAQTEIKIDDNLMAFLENYKALGFSDPNEVVSIALERLKDEMNISESQIFLMDFTKASAVEESEVALP